LIHKINTKTNASFNKATRIKEGEAILRNLFEQEAVAA